MHEVAIPSIQVGFFTQRERRKKDEKICVLSQSLLFRSVFSLKFCIRTFWRTDNKVAIPSIQVGFFTPCRFFPADELVERSQSLLFRSVFSLFGVVAKAFGLRNGRNPFYSGRFFHSSSSNPRCVEREFVAIPSIQVGFFTLIIMKHCLMRLKKSQSLLFRSVFSLKKGYAKDWELFKEVAIPSIQVGFFTPWAGDRN